MLEPSEAVTNLRLRTPARATRLHDRQDMVARGRPSAENIEDLVESSCMASNAGEKRCLRGPCKVGGCFGRQREPTVVQVHETEGPRPLPIRAGCVIAV